MKRKTLSALAVSAVVALGATACNSSPATPTTSSSGGSGSGNTSSAAANGTQNAAVSAVYKPSTVKGGTLRMGMTDDFDSVDPGDTYYGFAWNFLRNYSRTLVSFKSAPGNAGNELVPDLAESLGVPSDGGKTWTYKIRKGVKFEDGTVITSKDVKYGIARSMDKATFPNGPTYFNDLLADVPKDYTPYPSKNTDALTSIETPDDNTIVFHLKAPFSGFDYLAMLPATAPVPAAKDTGSKYRDHVISSGPYMFKTAEVGKSYDLIRNPNYDAATDPNTGRTALPDEITIAAKLDADDMDSRLMAGSLDVDIAGTGVQPATQAKIVNDPAELANTDLAPSARLWYASINPDVAPLDNAACRKAILLATDHNGYLQAYGGKYGGEIATSILPKVIPGHTDDDIYSFLKNPNGDVDGAKAALKECGQADGFSTTLSFRSDRPKEKAAAESLQQSLGKAGIKVTLKGFPSGDYFKLYAGKPDYAKTNGLGIMMNGWAADWNDGYGFLGQIVDSRVIKASGGNTNLSVHLPAVDTEIDKALQTTDAPARDKIWGGIDHTVMENAVILPGVWSAGLFYRPTTLSNVFINNAFGQYDYTALGVK